MTASKTYRVVWEIDVDAESPYEAAVAAFNAVRRPDTTATVFRVGAHTDELGKFAWLPAAIDLDEPGPLDRIAMMIGQMDASRWRELKPERRKKLRVEARGVLAEAEDGGLVTVGEDTWRSINESCGDAP